MGQFGFRDWSALNTNLVEDDEILHPVMFRQTEK